MSSLNNSYMKVSTACSDLVGYTCRPHYNHPESFHMLSASFIHKNLVRLHTHHGKCNDKTEACFEIAIPHLVHYCQESTPELYVILFKILLFNPITSKLLMKLICHISSYP